MRYISLSSVCRIVMYHALFVLIPIHIDIRISVQYCWLEEGKVRVISTQTPRWRYLIAGERYED